MNIQLINYSGRNEQKYLVSETNDFSNIRTFDSFDINIIDLNSEYIWRNKGNTNSSFNSIKDFKTIHNMLTDSDNSNSKIIFMLPQNIDFLYYFDYGEKYYESTLLKDMISRLEEHLNVALPMFKNDLKFGKNETILSDIKLESDFYFLLEENDEIPEKTDNYILSEVSKKIVSFTIMDKFFITSLAIDNDEQLDSYLKEAGLIEIAKADAPDWIKDVTMFDDQEQMELIHSSELEIIEQKKIISDSSQKLAENMRYKSVLYTQGDELVVVVIEMLEQILDVNLTEFVDEYDADLEFEIEDTPFVVEIKGINSNVKTSNLTQLLNHTATYGERNGIEIDDIKRLLIINHQRKKSLSEREPVHEKQVKYAIDRYDILIIETVELLILFEKFKNNKINVNECRQMILGKGLLKI